MIDIKACEMAVRWSGEDEGYVARVDRYQGIGALSPKALTGFGDTPEEAIRQLGVAIRLANEIPIEASSSGVPKHVGTIKSPTGPSGFADFLRALKARIGTLVLCVKEKTTTESCEADVVRCFLWSVEAKRTSTPNGEVDVFTVTLFPDIPFHREERAKMVATGSSANKDLLSTRIILDGPKAKRCILLDYEGLDDLVFDRLGPVDPAIIASFVEPPDADDGEA